MTLTLGSGRGLNSYTRWLTGLGCPLESARLVVQIESKSSSGTDTKQSCEASFQPPLNPTLLQDLERLLMSWGLQLTWWCVLRAPIESSEMSGVAGAVAGGLVIGSITKQDREC